MKRMLLACVFAAAKTFAQAPDLVLVNGRIATLATKSTEVLPRAQSPGLDRRHRSGRLRHGAARLSR
jgi:hypothetical protein